MLQALLAAAPSAAAAAGDSGTNAQNANGNVYGGINIGDSALSNRVMPSFMSKPRSRYSSQNIGDDEAGQPLSYMQAAGFGVALLVVLLIAKSRG